MDIDMNKEHWEHGKCPKYDCRKDACKCGLRKIFLASVLGDDSKDSPIAPKNGEYCNAIVAYEANGNIYIYSQEGIPTLVEKSTKNIEESVDRLEKGLAKEILDRQTADGVLQNEIDAIKNSPDVVDIVATYAALQAYDTSNLGDKDIIRVLADETHDGDSTYYRWDKHNSTWVYIGAVSITANTIFYANVSESGGTRHIYKNSDMTGVVSVQDILDANEKGQVILRMSTALTPENFNDAYLQNTYVGVSDYQFLFLDNRNYYEYDASTTADTTYYYSKSTIQLEMSAGTNITITGNTISATDTTYSNFVGTDGVDPGVAGLVPAPATTDAGKFLKADGTWDTAGGGGDIVYSTVTTSNATNGGAVYIGDKDINQAIQSDPTSTDNHYKYFWALPNSTSNVPWNNTVNIMGSIGNYGSGSVSILGVGATQDSVEIGNQAYAEGVNSVAIGKSSDSKANGVAIGEQANSWNYSVSIGSSAGLYSAGNMVSCVNIGNQAGLSSQSGNNFSVNLGANSRGTRKGEVNVGLVTGNTTSGYNDSAYRVIGGVYDGQLDHDVVTVGQLNGRVKTNAGAPTTSTVGTVGQLLEDTTNGKLYQCTAIDNTDPNNPSYTWTEVGAGGGGPAVVQTTGTSTTNVMSQNAVTERIYSRYGTYNDAIGIIGANETQDSSAGPMSIGIGSGHKARGDNSVVIGPQATVYAAGLYSVAVGSTAKTEGHSRAVALGNAANAAFDNSVAIGTNAKTTRVGEVNVGADTSGRGYNSTNYRVIGGVHDGQLAQDAVTVNQVNSVIDAINTALSTNIPHIGA